MRARSLRAPILLAVAILSPCVASARAQPTAPPRTVTRARNDESIVVDARYRAAAQRGEELVRAYMRQAQVPGMAVAVLGGGAIAWSEGFGSADLEQNVPVTRQTRFRLGSLSKLLTAATLMKLAEAGRLDLDAPVQRYVPSFPSREGPAITPRLLAGHLGGIRHYTAADFAPGRNIDQTTYASTTAAVAIFRDDSLVATPGSAYRYSTFGYTLVGAVVEGATGKEFTAVERDLVLAPLGMANTVPDRWDAIVPHRTRFYQADPDGAPLHDVPVIVSYKWPAGGMLSTADDMVRFGAAHLHAGFFPESSLATIYSSQKTKDGVLTHVGIGWRIARDGAGRVIHHHAGSIQGGRSVLLVYPAEGVVVAMLANRATAPVSPELMAEVIAEGFLPGAPAVRAEGGGMIATPAALKDRARSSRLPMPDVLPVLPGATVGADGETRVVASPLGLHPLRLRGARGTRTGELVLGVDGLELRETTATVTLRGSAP